MAQKVLEVESTSKTLAKAYIGKGENYLGSVSAAPASLPDEGRTGFSPSQHNP